MTASCCFVLFGKIWDWRIKKTKISAQKRTGAKNPKSNDCRFKEYTTTKERKRIGAPPWLKEHTDARWHFKLQSSAVRITFNTFSRFYGNAFGTEHVGGFHQQLSLHNDLQFQIKGLDSEIFTMLGRVWSSFPTFSFRSSGWTSKCRAWASLEFSPCSELLLVFGACGLAEDK